MTLLPWHSPYDWQWMFHFLGARTVQGIETFAGDSYCRSFALNGHAGLITVTPDDAAQGILGENVVAHVIFGHRNLGFWDRIPNGPYQPHVP